MGKSKTPPPPDYSQLAREQAKFSDAAVLKTTYGDRPTQNSAWGQTSWDTSADIDPGTGEKITKWTQNQTLDPQLQAALDSQMGLMQGRSELAGGLQGRLNESMGAVDYDQFRDVSEVEDPFAFRQKSEDAAYARATSRLDPRFQQSDEALEVKLRNQGLAPGDQAYDAAMGNYGREKTDAYQAAQNESVSQGRDESNLGFSQQQSQQNQTSQLRQQEIAEFLRARGQPLDDINNLVAGQGVQPASQAGFQSGGSYQGQDVMGAGTSQYKASMDAFNAKQAQKQGMMSGAASLAGMAMAPGSGSSIVGMMSDRRLKKDIVQIGTWLGRPLYHFYYLWGTPAVGVMSDEINQDAVFVTESGFDAVNYAAVTAA